MRDKLACITDRGKDSVKKLEKPSVVYKLKCDKCNASYVGETKRALMFRVEEHKADIEKQNFNKVVQRHCTHSHNKKPEKVQILDFKLTLTNVLYPK